MDAINLPDCLITSGAIHGTDPLIAFKLSSNDAVHSPDGKL